MAAQLFSHRQRETEGLSRASQISSYDVFPVEDRIEAVLLDREQTLDAVCLETSYGLGMDVREGRKLAVGGLVIRQLATPLFFARQAAILQVLIPRPLLRGELVVLDVTSSEI